MTGYNRVFIDTAPFIELFLNDLNFEIFDINKPIALKAAEIRAEHKNFKPMDSLQLATSSCDSLKKFLF